jgi:hypothetical protein
MMRRRILAISAVTFLVSAVVLNVCWPTAEVPLSFCWRMGAILAAAWLAFDDVQRLPNWLLLAMPVVLVVLVKWPRQALLLIPALILYGALRRFFPPKRGKSQK